MASALGMIETIGLVSALEAADAGLKAADVHLLGTDYVRGGLVMVRFAGEVAAVQAAVDAGRQAASRVGRVFSSHVIPRAEASTVHMVAAGEGPGGCAGCGGCEGAKRGGECEQERPASTIDRATPMAQLAGWKVVALRQAARRLAGFPLTPGEIRYANKQALLDAISAWQRH